MPFCRRGNAGEARPASREACHDQRVIAFIVPAHNEARLLGATLQAIAGATRELALAHEIVVVDDASTDDTAAIAAAAGARVVRIEARHIAAARNAGARASHGRLLIFVDADTRIDAAVLSAALSAMQRGAVGGGARVCLSGKQRLYVRWLLAVLMRIFRGTRIAPGCFLFCSRDAYVATGGFDEGYFAGEDVAMSRALARQGRFVILRQPVWTSDRKLRMFSTGDHLRLVWRFLLRGRRILRSREALALWYSDRRHGPE